MNLFSTLDEMLFTPIRAMRMRYLPPLIVFFAYGASTFSGVAESFFVKEKLHLSAESLMMLGVWLMLPWTTKMILGQLADSVTLFGSSRKSYLCLGACFMAMSSLLLSGLAGEWPLVMALGSSTAIYMTSSMLAVIGVVMQNVIADAMTIEVVPRDGRAPVDIEHELATVQLLGRLSISLAMFSVIGLGGFMASYFSYQTIFLLTLLIPLLSMTACFFVQNEHKPEQSMNSKILYWGFAYLLFSVVMAITEWRFNQEIILIVSLVIVIYLLKVVTTGLPTETLKGIVCAAIVIFIFRATPFVGPGLSWWEIDTLGFSKTFFGILGEIGTALAVMGMWLLAKPITQKPVGIVLVALTLVSFLLSLPVLGLYYGLHHWTEHVFGFGARTIAMVDTALASPFEPLSMVPMLTLIAIHAPRGQIATWFALMASLMNLALTTGGIISKQLNEYWVVSRQVMDASGNILVQADYSQLGALLWITTIAGTVLPILAAYVFLPGDFHRNRLKNSP